MPGFVFKAGPNGTGYYRDEELPGVSASEQLDAQAETILEQAAPATAAPAASAPLGPAEAEELYLTRPDDASPPPPRAVALARGGTVVLHCRWLPLAGIPGGATQQSCGRCCHFLPG